MIYRANCSQVPNDLLELEHTAGKLYVTCYQMGEDSTVSLTLEQATDLKDYLVLMLENPTDAH